MTVQIEHANMAVRDLDEAIRFFRTAFPEFAIRGRAVTDHGDFQSEWVHIGTEDTYVCLNADPKAAGDRKRGHQGYGVNHIGLVLTMQRRSANG